MNQLNDRNNGDEIKYSNMINASIDKLNIKQNYAGTQLLRMKNKISKKERDHLQFMLVVGLIVLVINIGFYGYLYSTRGEYLTEEQANAELVKKFNKHVDIVKPLENIARNSQKYTGLGDPNLSRDLTNLRNAVTELTPDPSVVVPGPENFRYHEGGAGGGIYWSYHSQATR